VTSPRSVDSCATTPTAPAADTRTTSVNSSPAGPSPTTIDRVRAARAAASVPARRPTGSCARRYQATPVAASVNRPSPATTASRWNPQTVKSSVPPTTATATTLPPTLRPSRPTQEVVRAGNGPVSPAAGNTAETSA